MVIKGTAGSGKTHTIRGMKKLAMQMLGEADAKMRFVFAAPTGTAAYNIRGVTLHSLFHLPVSRSFDCKLPDGSAALQKLEELCKMLWVLVLDERSMWGAKALKRVDVRLRQATKHSDLPFGGITVILGSAPPPCPNPTHNGILCNIMALYM